MATFALITEGVSDQIVLENILYGYFGYDIDVNPLQPLADKTDADQIEAHGGWEQLLRYCALPKLDIAIGTNDYVIIQIDTDVAEKYGVSKDNPFQLDPFVAQVRERIIGEIGSERYELFQPHIIFAICVHSLECWLLPLYAAQQHIISATDNCMHRLENELDRSNIRLIGSVADKSPDDYETISRPYSKKRRKWENQAVQNPSFALFLAELDAIVQV